MMELPHEQGKRPPSEKRAARENRSEVEQKKSFVSQIIRGKIKQRFVRKERERMGSATHSIGGEVFENVASVKTR
jgi:hypothetical protein